MRQRVSFVANLPELNLNLTLEAPTPQNGQTSQTVCWQKQTNCLSVFGHFAGWRLKGLGILAMIN